MFHRHFIPILMLLALASCGRPEFGATTEAGTVIDTDVDRVGANNSAGEGEPTGGTNNDFDGGPAPTAPPLDNQGSHGVAGDFAFNAYREVASAGRNAVVSPHGLARSLVIAHAAAGPELAEVIAAVAGPYLGGDIYTRFNSADLGLDGRQSAESFRMVGGVWIDEDVAVETELAEVLAMYLGLPVRLVDFASSPEDARNQINNWYSTETQGRISEVLGARTVDATTRFVVTDATWFDANWSFGGFDPDRTTYKTFQGSESNVQLSMMATEATLLHFGGQADLQAVVMPFDNGFSLIAVLPTDLEGFEAALEPGLLDRIISDAQPREIALEFPRIEVSDRVPLSSIAEAIGVAAMFAPGAEYLGFADGTQLADAHQRTRVSFNEIGLEGTTDGETPLPGTGSGGDPSAPDMVSMSFDRPFFFAVRDSVSGRYLFLGRVAQP